MRALVCILMLAGGWILGAGALPAAEVPPPDGDWRPHRLARCQVHPAPRGPAVEVMARAQDLFDHGAGGDAVSVLERGLVEVGSQPWLLLFLAQIYLLAGQGEPHCLPLTGPAAPTGDWTADRLRLLDRADILLVRLQELWRDDAAVVFLRADVARSRDDHATAADLDHQGRRLCTHMETFDLLRELRGLTFRPAKVLAPIAPAYPEAAARRRIQGEVVFDVLIDPLGRVRDAVQVGRADRDLAQAAREALGDGGFQAGQVGYYPVWSWLRIPIQFVLGN
jgi:TonB family protein